MSAVNGRISTTVDLIEAAYAQRTDVASATATYYGWASIGTDDTTGTAWRIARLSTSGSATALKYANGSPNFDQSWALRVGLTYT